MTKIIDAYFDFASPNAYLVHKVLPDIVARHGAKLNYIPCLLGGIFKLTNNKAPMIQFAEVKNKNNYDVLEFNRFIARHNLNKFNMNPHFPVNTVALMRGAIAAERAGILPAYIEAGMHHMWEAPKNMADVQIAADAFTQSGLDGASLMAQAQNDDIKAALFANTEAAVARGAFGIPTLFIGPEMFFGKERLGQLEDMLRG
jgi:2-hydroxychromene-2-carboxylate isomerase